MVAPLPQWLLPAFAFVALTVAAIWLSWRANERQASAEVYADALHEVRALRRLAADWDAELAGMQLDSVIGRGALTDHLARSDALEGRLQNAVGRIADPPARLANDLSAYLNAVDAHAHRVRQSGPELTATQGRVPAPRAQEIARQLSASAPANDMARLSVVLEDGLQAVQEDHATALARNRIGAGAMMIALVVLSTAVFASWRRTGSFRWPGRRVSSTPGSPALTEDVVQDIENRNDDASPGPAAQNGAAHSNGGAKVPKAWTSQFRTEQALLRHRMIAAMLAEELATLAKQVGATAAEPSTQAAAQRLASIAQGLAGLPSEQNTRYEVFDINDCLDDALESGTRGSTVEVTRYAGAAPQVFASRTEVVLLLANLIENAALASRDGGSGSIAVHTGEDRGRATVAVSDDGGGVALTMRERLLEPFHSSRQGRLGVGLAVAAQLAEKNGGTIAIDTGVQGVVATVTLPSAAA